MKSTPIPSTPKRPLKKLQLNRETLWRLTERELQGVVAGAPTYSPRCTFSEPSLCPTCLCTA